jgi:hypothetical protein
MGQGRTGASHLEAGYGASAPAESSVSLERGVCVQPGCKDGGVLSMHGRFAEPK